MDVTKLLPGDGLTGKCKSNEKVKHTLDQNLCNLLRDDCSLNAVRECQCHRGDGLKERQWVKTKSRPTMSSDELLSFMVQEP